MVRRGALSSIPEIEVEEDVDKEYVTKKKHEVLKAKYKCLKKLFQIYDASVIGILQDPDLEIDEKKKNRRRKRSHRTKTDACFGTNEPTNGDNTTEYEDSSVATGVIRDIGIGHSCSENDDKIDKYAETIDSDNRDASYNCNCQLTSNCHLNSSCHLNSKCHLNSNCHLNMKDDFVNYPHLRCSYEKRKLTRFQCFVQRLFGIRKEYDNIPDELYATSDPTLTCREKRRRRGLRFRRIRRSKKVKSDSALKDVQTPVSHVQLAQRYCLMDTTPRNCPIVGCNMISYGIINYNDHLNLCHFKDKKHICHFCHEGFENEDNKISHENEHVGISKFSALPTSGQAGQTGQSGQTCRIASDTQTEPEMKIPEEKLKKIVSFFDQMSDTNQILGKMKSDRSSETNLMLKRERRSHSDTDRSGDTRTLSCCNVRRTGTDLARSSGTDASSRRVQTCRYCGEKFDYRRQLSLHMDIEHSAYDRFKHTCPVTNRPKKPRIEMISEDGSINVQSNRSSTRTESLEDASSIVSDSLSRRKSDDSLSCDPSTNIVYCNSIQSLNKPSLMDSLVKKVRSYRWEPGTKIIRV